MRVFGMLALLLAGLLASPAAHAADAVKMGWVRAQVVLESTDAGGKIRSQSDEYIAARQKIIDLEQGELEAMEKKLKAQASLLSEQALAEKEGEFRKKLERYREKVTELAMEIEHKQAELLAEFSGILKATVASVARREGYAFVFDSPEDGMLVYADPAHDLTDKVIAELNAASKSE
ncbi:MAG: OmpH family outer membrane protein [Nitrospirota bacterium]|nr:OmpH family outer membrane protein [Nitrospirota bacterium]